MSRNLLILALFVSGAGCSATRPLLSTVVVTPPKLSFRRLPQGDSWSWTAVGVTYPSESLIPAACAPSPVHPVELFTFFEEDEGPSILSPSGPFPSATSVFPVPPVNAPVPAPSAIVQFEDTTCPQSAHLPASSEPSAPFGITPIDQTAVAITSPSRALSPPACAPSQVRPLQMVAFVEEDERSVPYFPSGPVPSVTTVIPVPLASAPLPIVHLDNATSPQSVIPSVPSGVPVLQEITPIIQTASMSTLPAPPVRVESPPSTESDWKPTTKTSLVSPVQTPAMMRCDQDATTLPQVGQVMPVESLPQPVLTHPDLSELLTEIRNQRLLIETLQRDLTRERSADDEAINELEAAVENLLVHTQTAQRELPTTIRK